MEATGISSLLSILVACWGLALEDGNSVLKGPNTYDQGVMYVAEESDVTNAIDAWHGEDRDGAPTKDLCNFVHCNKNGEEYLEDFKLALSGADVIFVPLQKDKKR